MRNRNSEGNISISAMIGNRVLSRLLPVRPRVTHPPVGPCRCGRAGSPSAVPPNSSHRFIITEIEMLPIQRIGNLKN